MLQTFVKMRKEDHRYFDVHGKEYISWSKFVKAFEQPFDEYGTIKRAVAKKRGVSVADIQAEWDGKRDKAADHGTRIHDNLDYYSTNFDVIKGNEDLVPLCQSVMNEFKDYYQTYSEECLYTKHGIAGTCDKIMVVSKGINSGLDVCDNKTNLSAGIEYFSKYNKYFLDPISHLSNCTYNKYSLQLSAYSYMLEEITGRKIRSLSILFIPPEDKLQYVRIPVPYLKCEIESMISYWMKNKREEVVESVELNEPTF